ncbi:hypothetical protein IFM89_029421 [Coptis chinensis]|uniref:Uncharacterized protein n=1 Tax=Coptis chinensis TaxID=261450 RepID=A0A835IT06_9MAGN|nr:hypothetical protein IFM89_029421 [Coptis chinensis]
MEGVTRVNSYPGGGSCEIHKALTQSKLLRNIAPGLEIGRIYAAEGYARVLSMTGVYIVSSSPSAPTSLVVLLRRSQEIGAQKAETERYLRPLENQFHLSMLFRGVKLMLWRQHQAWTVEWYKFRGPRQWLSCGGGATSSGLLQNLL